MKKILKAIGITARDVWVEVEGPVLGVALGAVVALLLCGGLMAVLKFPFITIGVVIVFLIALFIHKVSVNYRNIKMQDFDA